MPFVLFIAYILLETMAFWAVAEWIGVLWALLALALTMLFGMTIASWEVRRMMVSRIRQTDDGVYVMEDPTPGKTAGNVGLTMVGGILLSLPGFVSTVFGALLIFAPTRSIIRTLLAASMFRKIENMGVRVYEASPMAQHRDSYGSFGTFDAGASGDGMGGMDQTGQSHEVLDEDEIRTWTQHVKPEDFEDGKK
ncbi:MULTISPECIES: FxsA family protein [unclassified Corynebacterium]|uniref:FxsA family protein n=1 Tax=unclassified Corynebacterium TaxID=2624378 RepID=UPI0008A1BB2C|nr:MULTISPECIES: FxsA family protein [unclassified Corynebacterium]OFK65446.1 exlusion protein FxsA [Corynebacterium sp. HMSC076G08]OFK66828.1 exlusion protein FxsA [Corynebacterium sp. HMSC074A09]OFN35453.1 exlusion protein FxsA [Corynebacterium sp. HMSC072A04]OFN74747.1 exlusion protein FxsA [Corynebacterium sp. HMSC070E08]OHO55738.1 exlusion protein FxsA [Corynebacterium sp. HMSC035E02]